DDPDVTLRELLANRRARGASHKSPPTARYPSRSATKRPLYVGGDETDDSDDEFIPSGRKAPIKARKEGGRAKSTFSTTTDVAMAPPATEDTSQEPPPPPNPRSAKRKGHPRNGSDFDASGSEVDEDGGPPNRKAPRVSYPTSLSTVRKPGKWHHPI